MLVDGRLRDHRNPPHLLEHGVHVLVGVVNDHVVAPLTQLDGHPLGHDATSANAASTESATSSTSRPSVSTTASAAAV